MPAAATGAPAPPTRAEAEDDWATSQTPTAAAPDVSPVRVAAGDVIIVARSDDFFTAAGAEAIRALLPDPDLVAGELRLEGTPRQRGIGVIEAPRGTLFHDYEIDCDGLVTRANLIVSTTNNNQAMNESIRQVASHYLDGETLSEPLLNQIEVAIRAYDPCLSCASHAFGQMPLAIELRDAAGRVVDELRRD